MQKRIKITRRYLPCLQRMSDKVWKAFVTCHDPVMRETLFELYNNMREEAATLTMHIIGNKATYREETHLTQK